MKNDVGKYLQYMQSVKNSSPHTILNYGKDLAQFIAYLSPPGAQPPALTAITHTIIREFVAHLHDHGLQKSSIARKLAALRSFFKYCVREGILNVRRHARANRSVSARRTLSGTGPMRAQLACT